MDIKREESWKVKSENRNQVTDVIHETGGRSEAWARAVAAFGRCVQLWRARQQGSIELDWTRICSQGSCDENSKAVVTLVKLTLRLTDQEYFRAKER